MKNTFNKIMLSLFALFTCSIPSFASEADLIVPDVKAISPDSYNLLIIGIIVSAIGVLFGFIEF